MAKMTSMLLMMVILGLFIPTSQAVTCYACSSLTSDDCGDPFTSSSMTCDGNVCTKAKYEINGWQIMHLLSFTMMLNVFILTYELFMSVNN